MSKLRFYHFSHDAFLKIKAKTEVVEQEISSKPKSVFWFSDEDDEMSWSKFCDEDIKGGRLGAYMFPVGFDSEINMCIIEDSMAFDRFHRTYRDTPEVMKSYVPEQIYIDWRKVYDDYDGVLITPYLWGRRNMHEDMWSGSPCWYYSWDCASGFVFHPEKHIRIGNPRLYLPTENPPRKSP